MKPLSPLISRCLLLLGALWLAGCGSERGPTSEGKTLTLFAAASLTDAIKEIGDAFGQRHEVAMVYNFASSGALAQQLMAAPRADVFFSASEQWMNAVADAGLLLDGTRRSLLSNQLVVIANPRSEYALTELADLCELEFAYLAVGDPNSVPVGRYAKGFLESVACGDGVSAWQRLEERISPAPDARAALAQVVGRRDTLGIVYRTDAYARSDEVRVVWEIPAAEEPKIRYPVAVLRGSGYTEVAGDFLAYLGSEKARRRFEAAGFKVMAERGAR